MADYQEIEIESSGLRLSKVLWDHFEKRIEGVVEKTLELNPGLSSHLLLPVGQVIRVPLVTDTELAVGAEQTPVRYFD